MKRNDRNAFPILLRCNWYLVIYCLLRNVSLHFHLCVATFWRSLMFLDLEASTKSVNRWRDVTGSLAVCYHVISEVRRGVPRRASGRSPPLSTSPCLPHNTRALRYFTNNLRSRTCFNFHLETAVQCLNGIKFSRVIEF